MLDARDPYISFVAVVRNDNYGGDLLDRINLFLNSVIVLSKRYAVPSELVIVEWNPPVDRTRLREAVSWPAVQRKYCSVKIVEVSRELHNRLPNPQNLPLFEYIGKNVGIRHAKGQFILVTNPDIVFSEEIMKFFSSQQLSHGCFYRATRIDVKGPISANEPIERQIEFCKKNITRLHRYIFPHENRVSDRFNPYRWARSLASYLKQSLKFFPFQYPFMNASGDFLLMDKEHWSILRGYAEFPNRGHHLDSIMVLNALFDGLRQIVLANSLAIYHQQHDRPENGKPWYEDVKDAYARLLKERKSIIFNSESWGLGNEEMNEYIV